MLLKYLIKMESLVLAILLWRPKPYRVRLNHRKFYVCDLDSPKYLSCNISDRTWYLEQYLLFPPSYYRLKSKLQYLTPSLIGGKFSDDTFCYEIVEGLLGLDLYIHILDPESFIDNCCKDDWYCYERTPEVVQLLDEYWAYKWYESHKAHWNPIWGDIM